MKVVRCMSVILFTGRGGSDGCKIPVKIDALYGQGVMKVECGSQFSVALTRSGAVYTWYVKCWEQKA